MAEEAAPEGDADPRQLVGRLEEYRQLWERTAQRLVHEEYHAEDLVDDWFTLWGKVVRDTTALAAVTWRAGSEQARQQAERASRTGKGSDHRTGNNGGGEAGTGGDDGG